LSFWRHAGFDVARLGERRDSSSGMHSVQMLLGLNPAGRVSMNHAGRRFREQFPWRLAGSFQALPATLAIALMQGRDCADLPLSEADRADVVAFARGRRGLADVSPALWRWLVAQWATADRTVQPQQAELLLAAILQHQSSEVLARRTGLAGQRQQTQGLRAAVKNLLQNG